jgi:hypothetical protein
LALPPPEKTGPELLAEALGDETSSPMAHYPLPANIDPEYAATIRAFRALRPLQRRYCKALIQCYGKRRPALQWLLDNEMLSIDPATVSRWHKDPRFVLAVTLTKKQCLKMADIDPQSLMLRAAEVIDGAMEPQPIMDKHGNVVGHDVDRASALRGIEWIGKVHRMTEDTSSNRTTLEIVVNLATREQPVDVTPRDVLEG